MKNKLLLYFLLGLLIICMSACSDKWYAKQCSKRFPITASTQDTIKQIVGKVDTFIQLVQFDCDSAIKYTHDTLNIHDTIKGKQGHIFTIPCPPSTHQVDTFYHSKTTVEENSAKLFLVNATRDSLINQCKKKDVEISNQDKEISKQARHLLHLSLILILIVVAFGVRLALKLKK